MMGQNSSVIRGSALLAREKVQLHPGAARETTQLPETPERNLEPKNNEWVSF